MLILSIILLIVGFVFLIEGADIFVKSATSIAQILKIPSFIVGLTIVALGTSLPEASVSVTSALFGSNAIAISNVIGSNIFNMLLVIGLTCIIYKIDIKKDTLKQEFPIMIIVSLLMLIFLLTGTIRQSYGIILLLILIVYIMVLIIQSRSNDISDDTKILDYSYSKILIYFVVGLVGIILGGDFVVDSAQTIAQSFGLSETLIGLTIVSIGTSLPELITSITAAYNKNTELALGNALGSNIFNMLFIVGLTTAITPVVSTDVMIIDTMVMIVVFLITYVLAIHKSDFNRKDGLILTGIFIVYLIYIILRN